MDNNQVFEDDAELDVVLEAGLRDRTARTEGNGAGKVPVMTIEEDEGQTETSRLLGNGSTNAHLVVPGGGDDEDDISKWPRERDFEGVRWWKKPSVYWLLPGFFLYTLAFGGILVPRLNLTLSLICREYLSERAHSEPTFTFTPVILLGDNPQCQIPKVQELATAFALYVTLISGILSALSSPKLGTLSDRYGRKYILLFISSGGLIGETITILAANYPDTVHYSWLLVGAAMDGICGSFIAAMAITHSYAADCTPPPKLAVTFGYLHACLFGGIAIGPFVAANVVKATGNLLSVFYIALGCHVIFLLYILLVVPESLSRKRQLAAREKYLQEMEGTPSGTWLQALKIANILAPLKILYPTGEGSSAQVRTNLLLLSSVDGIIFGVAMGGMTVIIYYSELEFGWGDYETQMFVSAANVCRVTALMVMLPLLNYVFRTRRRNKLRRESGIELVERNTGSDNLDLYTIRFSLLLEIIGFSIYAMARVGPLFFFGGIVASFAGMVSPVLHSALAKHVPSDRTGQLMGALGLLHALARVVSPTFFSLLYITTLETFPQTVFVVLAACFGVAFVLSWFVKPHVYLEDVGTTAATGQSPEVHG